MDLGRSLQHPWLFWSGPTPALISDTPARPPVHQLALMSLDQTLRMLLGAVRTQDVLITMLERSH